MQTRIRAQPCPGYLGSNQGKVPKLAANKRNNDLLFKKRESTSKQDSKSAR